MGSISEKNHLSTENFNTAPKKCSTVEEEINLGDLPQLVAYHARVLRLQGDEVAKWCKRRGLMRCHWRTRVQEEMLAGDQRGEGLVRHR